MKKLISVICLVLVLVTMLAACSKFTCDVCGEKKSGKKHEEKVLGEKVVYCDDCYKQMKELGDLFK